MSSTPEGMPSPFVEELTRLLTKRRLPWRRLAELTDYHPSWLSKIRHGAPPSTELVRRCDEVLEAGGRLIALAAVEQLRRPAQLPAPPAGFVGREDELRRIHEVLTREDTPSAPAIVAIDGPPGVGKTAAALRCAHDVKAAHTPVYADGQLYADMRGYSQDERPARPGDVLEEFLVSLGVPAHDVPPGVEQRAKLYRSLLASRRLLIVLDNAASSAQIEPLLPGSTGSAVVVTSRRRLVGLTMRVGAERVMLGPMTEAESMAVLRDVIGSVRTSAEAASLSVLAERCGYLPLALRIAAERIAAHPNHPVSELVDELAVGRQRLDGLATDDSVAVRTVFEWSYRDLGAPEARMFRLLGLHLGPHLSVDAAAALAGIPMVAARHALQKLAEVHLLEGVPQGRYHFHDLLRLYAAERVEAEDSAADRAAAVGRLTDWYLLTTAAGGRTLAPFRLNPLELPEVAPGVAPLAFDDDQVALRWYDAETPNFAPIIRLAIDHALYDRAWKLAVALFDYLRLLRKPAKLWLDTSTLAMDAARAAGDRYAEGWVETSLAEGYRWLRQYDRSQALFEHALAVRQDVGDRHGQAWALAGSGFLAVERGSLEAAYDYTQKALAIFREVHDRHGEASALFTLADAYHGWKRHDEALAVLGDSLRIFEEIENHDGQGLTLMKMADVHIVLGEHQQALDYLKRSVEARRLAGSRWGEAAALARQGRTLVALGRPREARKSWEAALGLYEEVDDPKAADIRAYLMGHTTDLGSSVLSPPAW